jgi:hypothetical protein
MQINGNLTFVLGSGVIQNVILEPLSSAPGTTVVGRVYYNTTNNSINFYNGSAWTQMVSSGAGPLSVLSADAFSISNLNVTYVAGTTDAENGTGVGANGAIVIDGYTASLHDQILVGGQTSQTQNGLYTVTATGNGSAPFVLTRSITYDNHVAGLVAPGNLTYVIGGTTYGESLWVQTTKGTSIVTHDAVIIGTNVLNYVEITTSSGSGSVTSVGLADDSPVPIYTVGSSPITSNGTLTLTLKTQSANLFFGGPSSGGATAPSFRSIIASDLPVIGVTIGSTTINLGATATTLAGLVAVTSAALTVSGLTANSFLYSGTSSAISSTTAPTNGQLLIGSSGGAPVLGNITSGTGIGVTNGAGSITVSNTGVLSITAGTNISVSGSTGAVTINVTGTVAEASNIAGGSGGSVPYQSAANTTSLLSPGTSGQALISNGSGAPSWNTLRIPNPIIQTTTYAAVKYDYIIADTASAAFTITLPGSPTFGDIIWFVDGSGTWGTNNLTINGNGLNIMANTSLVVTTARDNFSLIYYNSPQGWIIGD